MTNIKKPYDQEYDLSNCDAEPLHRIRLFQPSALFIAVNKSTLALEYVSENTCKLFQKSPEDFLQLKLTDILSDEDLKNLGFKTTPYRLQLSNPIYTISWQNLRNENWQNLLVHETAFHYLMEFEHRSPKFSQASFLQSIDKHIEKLQGLEVSQKLFQETATTVSKLAGFDRVMIYRFDEAYNGEVIAEEKQPDQEAYLGLRYPHTDIPSQARALYLLNRIRQVTNTDAAKQVYIHRAPGAAELDLTMADNRGVSSFHLEYLSNMGVGATLSAAIVVNQKLWGLIACHHNTEKMVDYRMRSMISFFCKIISGHLALQESQVFRSQVLQTQMMRSELFERMSDDYDIIKSLTEHKDTLLKMTQATGCILFLDNQLYSFGKVPNHEEAAQLIEFLNAQEENLYANNDFFKALPIAKNWQNDPAGVLSIRVSHTPGEYIIWFRPEVVNTVLWGGNPDERKVIIDSKVRLSPRISFAKWEQRLDGIAEKWQQHHLDAALALRNDLKEVIIQRYHKIRALNVELTTAYQDLESFSYTVSHDLRAPLRTILGFAEILEEDYGEILDEEGHSVLQTIMSSVGKMNQFINDILNFSRLGRTELIVSPLDLREVIDEAWRTVKNEEITASLEVPEQLPQIPGDVVQIRRVFTNLFSNSIKYARAEENPHIQIDIREEGGYLLMDIKDNGIGFDMKYAERIFVVFHRLVSGDKYEGTGIGLAIVKRIIESHQGEIRVSSKIGEGTTFTLAFNMNLKLDEVL